MDTAFSVSESNVEALPAYISDQAEHHRKFSYQQEVRVLLKRHRVAFDERYLWE
jgi:putative transposase